MKIKFCGAATSVTGSCHYIETESAKFLLDCGMFQGNKATEALNREPFPFEPAEIDFVLMSHAHVDHSGRLPLLVKGGFRGTIYCTNATADLLEVMLRDCGHIQERETEIKNRKAQRLGHALEEPLYTTKDAEEVFFYIKPVLYGQVVEISPGIRVKFNDAGHLLGSAITEIWITEKGQEKKLVYSGDLGVKNRPILRDPTVINHADYLIMEATYGNRIHEENVLSIDRLADIVMKTRRRGGSVIIPAFAVGRTQEMIYEFHRFYKEHPDFRKELDDTMVYVDSPMATMATQVFKKNAEVFDEETRDYILQGYNPIDFINLRFVESTEESKELNLDTHPKIVISASGMCEAGRIKHHLKHNIWDARNSIVFVGYQAEGTLGHAILHGSKEIMLFGEKVHVAAEIYDLEGFSGHADRNGLLEWLGGFRTPPEKIFIVHGEEQSKLDFAADVKKELGYDTIVVTGISQYDLDLEDGRAVEEQAVSQKAEREFELLQVKARLSDIRGDLENILYNTHLAANEDIDDVKLREIHNLLIELERNTINLGSVVADNNVLG